VLLLNCPGPPKLEGPAEGASRGEGGAEALELLGATSSGPESLSSPSLEDSSNSDHSDKSLKLSNKDILIIIIKVKVKVCECPHGSLKRGL
jgi:hypothetical protein